MSAIFCIIDGMLDHAGDRLKSLPALQQASAWGDFATTPPGLPPDSLVCIGTLLGLCKAQLPICSRTYLETVGSGIPADKQDLFLRCNLVKLDNNGALVQSGAELPIPQMQQIAGDWGLIWLGGYRFLKVEAGKACKLAHYSLLPSHQNIGAAYAEGVSPSALREWMQKSRDALRPYALWPWAPSIWQPVKAFSQKAAAVCHTPLVRGLCMQMGMQVFTPSGATGDIDTDLAQKLSCALRLAKAFDFVLLHINGADEAAHRQKPLQKQAFLQKINAQVLIPLCQSGHRVLITGDHITDPISGRHMPGEQPFYLFGGAHRGNLGQLNGVQACTLLAEKEG